MLQRLQGQRGSHFDSAQGRDVGFGGSGVGTHHLQGSWGLWISRLLFARDLRSVLYEFSVVGYRLLSHTVP